MASVGSHVFPRQIQLEVSCSFGKANVTFDKGLSSSLADIAFSVGDGSAFSIVVLISDVTDEGQGYAPPPGRLNAKMGPRFSLHFGI